LSPIDGIVIARNVDVGQTVAASLQAPTLFVIAADLREMQLSASIDESDVGQIKPGQPVTFGVDAYPDKRFRGTVEQVRLNPTVASNVVTYAAMITAPNPGLELKPGMTATVTVEVSRRNDVLRVPNAALRFRPSEEALDALGLGTFVSAGASVASRGTGAGSGTTGAGSGVSGVNRSASPTVWLQADGTIRPISVRTGVSDGVSTELLDGDLAEGATVVTRVTLAGESSASTPAARSPLMPTGPPRR
jgi:HlyD family secretion protein